jgi:hypothetical protein
MTQPLIKMAREVKYVAIFFCDGGAVFGFFMFIMKRKGGEPGAPLMGLGWVALACLVIATAPFIIGAAFFY